MPASLASLVTPTNLWLLVGLVLCGVELLVPTAFVIFMMGVSALLVGIVSLLVPQVSVQVALWMVFSLLSVYATQRLLPKKTAKPLESATEAETLTEIPAGKTGRVLYEGNSWRAVCSDETISIAPHEKVHVVRREGNTIVVLPLSLLRD
jgi:membrane protein implicated in regulation of membrane protease activity